LRGHDLHWVRLLIQREMTGEPELLAEIDCLRALEDRICGQSQMLLYPSAEECDIRRKKFPQKTIVEMPVVYFEREALAAARSGLAAGKAPTPFHLMFVGGFAHPPNADGILWFLDVVFPRLLAREPGFCLTVAFSALATAVPEFRQAGA
jgi:O-antigen biosynthesis protein